MRCAADRRKRTSRRWRNRAGRSIRSGVARDRREGLGQTAQEFIALLAITRMLPKTQAPLVGLRKRPRAENFNDCVGNAGQRVRQRVRTPERDMETVRVPLAAIDRPRANALEPLDEPHHPGLDDADMSLRIAANKPPTTCRVPRRSRSTPPSARGHEIDRIRRPSQHAYPRALIRQTLDGDEEIPLEALCARIFDDTVPRPADQSQSLRKAGERHPDVLERSIRDLLATDHRAPARRAQATRRSDARDTKAFTRLDVSGCCHEGAFCFVP